MNSPGQHWLQKQPWPNAKRILVMRYRFIGDTILTVPFLRNLRACYPDSHIDVLVGPQSGSILQGCPYINELLYFDTTNFHRYDRGRGPKQNFFSFAVKLYQRKYDLVFVLKRSFSSAVLAFLTGAKLRVGYNTEGRGFLLTHRVRFDTNKHEVESVLDNLRALEIPIHDTHLESFVTDDELLEVTSLVPQVRTSQLRLLIHAAAAHPAKMYPLNLWSEVMHHLNEKYNPVFFFTGSAQDQELYNELQTLSGISGVNLAGKLSLRQSLALYHKMDLSLCVDSGPAHMSASTQTPTLVLFGPSNPNRWRPWGEGHQAIFQKSLAEDCPCQINKTCQERPCLTKLAPSVIVSKCPETILPKTFTTTIQH